MQVGLVLVLLLAALVLLSLERLPVDVVAVGLLVTLLLSGVLTPQEALSGFGNEAVVVLAGVFVLSAALRNTGAIDALGRWLECHAEDGARAATGRLLVVTTAVSGFLNNTSCTAVFVPTALGLSRRMAISSSQILMPLAFASILGGTLTAIGTSTNLIVRGLMPQYGMEPLGLFELLPVALPTALSGLLYLWLAAPRLLPQQNKEPLADRYPLRDYLSEVVIPPGSRLSGATVRDADLGKRFDLTLLAILRGKNHHPPTPHEELAIGDALLVEGRLEALLAAQRQGDIEIVDGEAAAGAQNLELVEVLVLPRSDLVGRTLAEAFFRQRVGASVVALHRQGHTHTQRLSRLRLAVGDILILQAGKEAAERVSSLRGLTHLGSRPLRRPPRGARAVAAVTFASVIVAAASGGLELSTAMLLGSLIVVASRCLTPEEAYRAIEWRIIVLVVGMMAYGTAMEQTGAAAFVADSLSGLVGHLGPRACLAGLYVATLVLTQPMSNQAAALVVFPLAMKLAAECGLNLRAASVTVALAASSSFLTPLEPSCLLVYGPGGYRFIDFPRLGAGLSLLCFLIALVLVPVFWPS